MILLLLLTGDEDDSLRVYADVDDAYNFDMIMMMGRMMMMLSMMKTVSKRMTLMIIIMMMMIIMTMPNMSMVVVKGEGVRRDDWCS